MIPEYNLLQPVWRAEYLPSRAVSPSRRCAASGRGVVPNAKRRSSPCDSSDLCSSIFRLRRNLCVSPEPPARRSAKYPCHFSDKHSCRQWGVHAINHRHRPWNDLAGEFRQRYSCAVVGDGDKLRRQCQLRNPCRASSRARCRRSRHDHCFRGELLARL